MIDILLKNRIHQMDCIVGMDYIPDKSIGMIFTDPPYKLIPGGMTSKSRKINIGKKSVFNNRSVSGTVFKTPKYESWISKLPRILKDDSYVFCMTNDLNVYEFIQTFNKYNFKLCEILVMKKRNKVTSLYFFKQCEFILMFRNGRYKKFNKYGISNVFDVSLKRGDSKIHPSEKPVKMISDIIHCCSYEKDLILDPFAGSGSTCIAAYKNNRDFIGFEIGKEYFDLARNRLNDFIL